MLVLDETGGFVANLQLGIEPSKVRNRRARDFWASPGSRPADRTLRDPRLEVATLIVAEDDALLRQIGQGNAVCGFYGPKMAAQWIRAVCLGFAGSVRVPKPPQRHRWR